MALDELAQIVAIDVLEEAEERAQYRRQMRRNEDPFNESDTAFVKLYRLTKEAANGLIDMLTPHMTAPTRVSALSIERKVFTALRFFACGSYQLDVGKNLHHAVSQSSVSRCIEEVSNALNAPEVFNTHIRLPETVEELALIRRQFSENHDFPGVMGCLDCTHVAIYPPQINDPVYPEHLYVNRKGYHSINTQLICDADLKILNVSARYPGSTHDSFIWNNSNALQYMQTVHRRHPDSYYLLGDSGYGLRPWLLTPVLNAAPNSPEENYNARHRSTRSVIERCNGVLKLRFRCLLKHRVLHYAPEKAAKIINACCVLHNICTDFRIPEIRLGDDPEDANLAGDIDLGMFHGNGGEGGHVNEGNNRVNPELAAGRRLQNMIIRNYFRE